MRTFLIDEELRDKLALVTENGIFDYCQRLRDLPETKPDPAGLVEALERLATTTPAKNIFMDEWQKGYYKCLTRVNEISYAALSAYRGEK